MTTRSLSETTSLAKRAIRGAGYDWGVCDDIAAAVDWLVRHGLPGVDALDRALARAADPPPLGLPITSAEPWGSADGRPLCPFQTGLALADHLHLTSNGGRIAIRDLEAPLLVAGCAAMAGESSGRVYRIAWDAFAILGGSGGGLVEGDPSKLLSPSNDVFVCIEAPDGGAIGLDARHRRPAVDARVWDRLEDLAAKTYAPATEASRIKGAGPSA